MTDTRSRSDSRLPTARPTARAALRSDAADPEQHPGHAYLDVPTVAAVPNDAATPPEQGAVEDLAPAPRRAPEQLRRGLIGIDVVGASAGWLAALVVLPPTSWAAAAGAVLLAGLATVVTLGFTRSQHLYRSQSRRVRPVEIQRLARAVVLAGIVVLACQQLLFPLVSAERVGWGALGVFGTLLALRSVLRAWLGARRRGGQSVRQVVLIGADDEAAELAQIMRDHPELGYRVCGVVSSPDQVAAIGAPWLGDLPDAARVIRAANATAAFVVVGAIPSRALNGLARELLDAGVHVHVHTGLRGIASHRVRVMPLAYEPLLYIDPVVFRRWQLAVKRAVDVVVASVMLVATAPLVAGAMLAIRLEDGGPVLFRQARVGKDGALFTMLKLRSMATDAEQRMDELWVHNQRTHGPLFKLGIDPRVTKVGRFLRASSIDELPQLLNVLDGSMSLVGPRPALPHEAAQFDERLRQRSRAVPGITGLWQVEARDNPEFGPYQRLDLYYVENWSVGLDLSILLMTAGVVLARSWRAARSASAGPRRTHSAPAVFE